MRRIRQQTGVEFRFHDLRRTAASHMTGIGISRLVVGKILNHAERDVTAVYDRHSYDADKQEALLKWNQRVEDILRKSAAAGDKVVPLVLQAARKKR
jgi:integrase